MPLLIGYDVGVILPGFFVFFGDLGNAFSTTSYFMSWDRGIFMVHVAYAKKKYW